MYYNESWSEHLVKLKHLAESPWRLAVEEGRRGKSIFPLMAKVFAAFDMAYDDVKVVIIGQDPYHGPNQANGLAFSVSDGVTIPPSLKNIYKELKTDIGIDMPETGNLTPWVREGVLLLNTTLTVERGRPASHKNFGWDHFTTGVIKMLSEQKENLVFILWGKHAQQMENVIDTDKHYIIKSAHPSPFSADRGFFGSKPFSRANLYLVSKGKRPVDWDINSTMK